MFSFLKYENKKQKIAVFVSNMYVPTIERKARPEPVTMSSGGLILKQVEKGFSKTRKREQVESN